jgi:hypothetical protein
LAGILRVADGLDIRQQGVVSEVRARWGVDAVVLDVEGSEDLRAELGAAEFKADLLAKTLGRAISPRGVATLPTEA